MQLQAFFDISQASDKAAFRRRLIDFAHAMDFPLISCVLTPGHDDSQWSYVGNAPPDFNESTDRQLMAVDPVLERLRSIAVPFAYDQNFYVRAKAGELWEIAAPYGYRTGIAVNLPLANGGRFLLGIDRERALPKSNDKLARLFADLQLLAVHAQDSANRLMHPATARMSTPGAEEIRLTPREREVLEWTMGGKSSWVIGNLLSLSENTVNFHIRGAIKKLNVSSKHQAVLKAIGLGLISPPAC